MLPAFHTREIGSSSIGNMRVCHTQKIQVFCEGSILVFWGKKITMEGDNFMAKAFTLVMCSAK